MLRRTSMSLALMALLGGPAASVYGQGPEACNDSLPAKANVGCVEENKRRSTQTGPCCEGLTAVYRSGCRCLPVDGASPTPTTSTTRPPAPTTSTTRPARPTTTTYVRPPVSTTSTTSVPTRPTTTTTLDLMRFPTGRDVTIRLTRRKDRCKYMDGQTATQVQRASMYLVGVARLMYEGMLYAKYNPHCWDVERRNQSNLQTEDTRLRVYYVDEKRDSQWSIEGDNGCPDYQHVHDLGEAIQACSTADDAAKVACAASLYMTGDLLDYADLRIEAGRCERGARFPIVLPGFEDARRSMLGALDYDDPLPPISPKTMALARELMQLHHDTDHAYCDGTGGPLAGSVKRKALELANSAVDVRQQHALFLEFTSAKDEGSLTHKRTTKQGWTRQEHCDWGVLKGFALQEWERCLSRPPETMWACLTRTRATHETLHGCAAYKSDRNVRIGDHTSSQLTGQPARTCALWLKCQTGELPGCRLPWVPENWRVLIGQGAPM